MSLSSLLKRVILQDLCKGALTAGVAADDAGPGLVDPIQYAADHFMGHRAGKQDQKIGTSDLFIQSGPHLGKYLRLPLMVLADLLILPDHPVMASNDHNAHIHSPFPGSVISILVSYI